MNKDSWCFKYSFAKVCKNKCEAREECMKNAIRKAKEKEILENIKIATERQMWEDVREFERELKELN